MIHHPEAIPQIRRRSPFTPPPFQPPSGRKSHTERPAVLLLQLCGFLRSVFGDFVFFLFPLAVTKAHCGVSPLSLSQRFWRVSASSCTSPTLPKQALIPFPRRPILRTPFLSSRDFFPARENSVASSHSFSTGPRSLLQCVGNDDFVIRLPNCARISTTNPISNHQAAAAKIWN